MIHPKGGIGLGSIRQTNPVKEIKSVDDRREGRSGEGEKSRETDKVKISTE